MTSTGAEAGQRPWWFDAPGKLPTPVLTWLDDALLAAGRVRLGAVEITHVRAWSLVARAETDGGSVYLKACAPGTAHEVALLEILAREAPGAVVAPLAADPERGLLLTPDGGPLLGDSVPGRSGDARESAGNSPDGAPLIPLTHTTPAALGTEDPQEPGWGPGLARGLAGMAQLQRRTAHTVPELLDAGVPDMRPQVLLQRFDEALDAATRRARRAESGWLREQVVMVKEARPHVADEAAELGALAVAPAVNHDDLHPWNLLRPARPGRAPLPIDWGDAVVSHPFSVLLVPLRARRHRVDTEPGVSELRRAYLGAWQDVAPHFELRRAADLACRLGAILRAHAWLRVLRADDDAQEAGAAQEVRAAPEEAQAAPRGRRMASSDLVPLLWLRNLALPSCLGVPTLQG